MMRHLQRDIFIATTIAGLMIGANAAQAAVQLVPHRAVYDLSLGNASDRSGIEAAHGRMVIEVSGSNCDGWTVNFRLVNQFSLGSDNQRLIDTRSTSWESGDGKDMRYLVRQFINGKLQEETSLKAKMDGAGKAGMGAVIKPKPKAFKLPVDALFPVAHQIHLIEQAEKGTLRDKSVIFDGSDSEKAFEAISFIGKKHVASKSDVENLKGDGVPALSGVNAWPVTISYFDYGDEEDNKAEDMPIYQASFLMYDNGIASNLTLNYGDFSLKGALSQLDKMPVSACDKQ